MFDRFKRKVVDDIKDEAYNQFCDSAHDGRIHTGAVAVEGLLFLGLLILGGGGRHRGSSEPGENIHIHIHND